MHNGEEEEQGTAHTRGDRRPPGRPNATPGPCDRSGGYHVANFGAERARKKELMAAYVNVNPILIVRHLQQGRP